MTTHPATTALPRRFNMAAYCLQAGACAHGSKTALIVVADGRISEPAETWTYAGLEDAVLRTSAALMATGLHRGDRVLIRLENTSAYAILFFACLAAGLVAVPASSQLTDGETRFLIDDSGASAIAVSGSLSLANLPPEFQVFRESKITEMGRHTTRADYAVTSTEDPAYLIYTSGTTARPKGVLHAHRVALGRTPTYQGWYAITPHDRMLHAGAFNWTYTLGTGLIDPWANGATSIVYTGEKHPEVWPDLIKTTGATLFAAVPGLFRQILKYAAPGHLDVGRLRHGLIAGETPPPHLFADWKSRTGTDLYEALGMSEISTFISTSPDVPRKSGTTGKPQPGRRVVILPIEGGTAPLGDNSPGLLAVHRSDPGLMLGYWNRPEEEAQVLRGEWFIGGDLASMDLDGYVTHLGRANDLLNAMGYRVSPLEVEAVLAEHPSVAEVACAEVRLRDDLTVIGAFIVLRGQTEYLPDPDAIIAFARTRLAAYKCPREVCFVASLPRTANGKVQRAALRILAISESAPSSRSG